MSYRAIVYWGGLKAWSPSLEDLGDPALPLGGKIFARNYVKTTQCVCLKAKGVGGVLRKIVEIPSLWTYWRLSLKNKAINSSCIRTFKLTQAVSLSALPNRSLALPDSPRNSNTPLLHSCWAGVGCGADRPWHKAEGPSACGPWTARVCARPRALCGSQGKAILPWSPEPAKVKAAQGDLEALLERGWKWEANFSKEIIITEVLEFWGRRLLLLSQNFPLGKKTLLHQYNS